MNISRINTQWTKVDEQYALTSLQLNSARENNNSVNGIKLKAEISNLQRELAVLYDLIPGFPESTPASNTVEDLERRLAVLKETPQELPSDSEDSFRQTRKRDRSSSGETRKRVRSSSGEISSAPTLQEIEDSLVFTTSEPDSVANLRKAKTNKEKLEILYLWEKQSHRQTIRYAFHQGYYIDTICESERISTRTLAKTTTLSLSELQRKRQLYTDLGDYRKLIYSSLPLYRIINNTKKIKEQLEKLSPSELHTWKHPISISLDDPSGLLTCFINCNQGQLSNKIYYRCDLYNHNLYEIPIEQAVEALCMKLFTLSDVKTTEQFEKSLSLIAQQKCIVGYKFDRQWSKDRARLGVHINSTPEQVKNAYEELAKNLHPDVNISHDANATFRELTEVYDRVCNGQDEIELQECTRFSLLIKDEQGFNSSDSFYHELLFDLSKMKEAHLFALKE